jgi:hypothetical protein
MKITATVSVTIARPDGTTTSISETVARTPGDNPRHEAIELEHTVALAADRLTARHATEPTK